MKAKLCDFWFLLRPYLSTILVAFLLVGAFRFVPQIRTLFPTAEELKVAGLWRSVQFFGYESKRKSFATVAGKATQTGSPQAASDDLRSLLPGPLTGAAQSQYGSGGDVRQSRVPQVRSFDGEADAFSRIKRRLAE